MSFNSFIKHTLELLQVDGSTLAFMTNAGNLDIYRRAFTHSSVNVDDNYEKMEQIGDGIINSVLVNYFHRKFPDIDVGIAARLKIKYASKTALANFARRLDFQSYISVLIEPSQKQWESILEDVFEAFFGATFLIMSNKNYGAGYLVCTFIMENLMKEEVIDLSREALFDAKTRLKELFDLHKELGTIVYKSKNTPQGVYAEVYRQGYNGTTEFLGSGISQKGLKMDAEQSAAEVALAKYNGVF